MQHKYIANTALRSCKKKLKMTPSMSSSLILWENYEFIGPESLLPPMGFGLRKFVI